MNLSGVSFWFGVREADSHGRFRCVLGTHNFPPRAPGLALGSAEFCGDNRPYLLLEHEVSTYGLVDMETW